MCIAESPCCTAVTGTALHQLYFSQINPPPQKMPSAHLFMEVFFHASLHQFSDRANKYPKYKT